MLIDWCIEKDKNCEIKTKQMASCEMCGKEGGNIPTIVEGITLNLCKNCSKHGKVLSKPRKKEQRIESRREEMIENLAEGYGKKIREAREKNGLTQKEMALQINEKESILQKIENEQFKPTIGKAKKLEKVLKIKLLDSEVETPKYEKTKTTGALTIGDLIKTN